MMKIRPYPGKIALIQNQDGVEKEVTMNYESNWQECLQLWGSQNNYPMNGHYAVNAVNGVNGGEFAKNVVQTPAKNQVNGCVLENVNYADYDALYNSNEPVSSHSFNYFNNFAQCDPTVMTNYTPANGNALPDDKPCTKMYGRQRYFPQMLEDAQPQNGVYQAQETLAGCSVEYVTPPAQSFPVTEATSWVIPETVTNVQNGFVAGNYPYKNHRKLHRTPTMIDKNVALPYGREHVADAMAGDVPCDNGFLIPRPKLIVPVHTYGSRKRRTGNILHSKRRGSDTEPCSSTSTSVESKKHHTSCPGKTIIL